MRLILVGDIHLADRPPSIRTEDYTDHVFEKLAEVNDLAEEHAADAIVQAGDVFHIKTPSRTSHRLVQRVITDVLNPAPVSWYIVPGNHDMQHDRLSSLEGQPLGTLYEAGAVGLVGENYVETAEGTIPIFGIPYLQDWAELDEVWGAQWRRSDAGLMVTHASIFPNGDRPPFEHFTADDWAQDIGRPGDIFFGHIHDHYGVFTDTSGDYVFCNHGALTRGSLAEHDLKREVSVTLYDDTNTAQPFTRIPLKSARPVDEVFYMSQKEEADAGTRRLDTFLAKVEGTTIERISLEGVMSAVEANADITEGARREIRAALEEAIS